MIYKLPEKPIHYPLGFSSVMEERSQRRQILQSMSSLQFLTFLTDDFRYLSKYCKILTEGNKRIGLLSLG